MKFFSKKGEDIKKVEDINQGIKVVENSMLRCFSLSLK